MKRVIFIFSLFLMCTGSWSQEVFTVVYATSSDGFLNVRERPSSKARILSTLPVRFHDLGRGILLQRGERWSKIRVNNSVTGWVYNKYLGYQTWYTGKGKSRLIANLAYTPIYIDNYADDGEKYLPFCTVGKGVILADEYDADELEDYYVLKTGHDYLFIKKEDVIVR